MQKCCTRMTRFISAYLCMTLQSLCLAEAEPPKTLEQDWTQILHSISCSKQLDRRSEQAKNLYRHACLEKKWSIVGVLLKHGIEMPEEAEDLGNIELTERTIIEVCQQVIANSGPPEALPLSI